MQKIVIFGEPNDDAWIDHAEVIGNLFLSRFEPEFEEEDSFKLVKILELEESAFKLSAPQHREYSHYYSIQKRNKKGMSLST